MSKFIPQKSPKIKYNFSDDFTYGNRIYINKNMKKEENHIKKRIENIKLEDLSFKDLYKFPFKSANIGQRVYDSNNNFIFQFEPRFIENNYDPEFIKQKEDILSSLNGEIQKWSNIKEIFHKNGEIFIGDTHIITIRGWGNLTGIGSYNLDAEYAAKIQDTLADYIVETLNKNYGRL